MRHIVNDLLSEVSWTFHLNYLCMLSF